MEIKLLKSFSVAWSDLVGRGFDIDQVENTAAAHERLLAIGKPAVTPVMSVQYNDFTDDEAFGVFLSQEGEDVAGVLVRMATYRRPGAFAEYVPRSLSRLYDVRVEFPGQVGPPDVMRGIHGKVAYMGDLFVAPGARGVRSVLADFVRVMQIAAYVRWDFDWAVAFMRTRDVQRGFAQTYGFTRTAWRPLRWQQSISGRGADEYFVAVSGPEFVELIDAYVASELGTQ